MRRKATITQTGQESYTLSYKITDEQLKSLDNAKFPFRTYKKDNQQFAVFYREDLQMFCSLTGMDYMTESQSAEIKINNRIYAELKYVAANSGDKLSYRVVDVEGLKHLKNGTLRYYCKENNGKYNIAFLNSDLQKYQEIIQPQREVSNLNTPGENIR